MSLLAGATAAQTWPAKPVRVVVGFTAGGTTDVLARNVGQQLGDKFKQPFVVDNKPGAGGNLGTEIAIRAPADGYTLLVASVGPIAVNPTLYPKLGHNPQADLVPIVLLADVPNVLVVHPSVPANTLEEFVAYARANPGKLNYCSTGIGTSSHLSGFLLAKRAGLAGDARAVQRRRCAERPAQRPHPVHVRDHPVGAPAHRRRRRCARWR